MPRGYPKNAKAMLKKAKAEVLPEEDDIIGNTAPAKAAEPTIETVQVVCPIDGGVFGDKHPDVVDWWYENHPAIAEKLYHRRITHRTPR